MMNPSPNSSTNPTQPGAAVDPEATLRLLATLAPPDGLTDRVHQSLAAQPPPASFWSFWMPARRLQFAGAALLMTAIVASSWTVYEGRQQRGTTAQKPIPTVPSEPSGNGFTPAGAERHPSTLKPIKVPPAPKKKKPSPARTTIPHTVKPGASTPGEAALKPRANP